MEAHSVASKSQTKASLDTLNSHVHSFLGQKRIWLTDFLPGGQTINKDVYCETLRKLCRAIQNKRQGMLTKGVVFFHDNA